MAENGATILEIMLADSWKSEKVARTYVEKSFRTKVLLFSFRTYAFFRFRYTSLSLLFRSVYRIC